MRTWFDGCGARIQTCSRRRDSPRGDPSASSEADHQSAPRLAEVTSLGLLCPRVRLRSVVTAIQSWGEATSRRFYGM